MPSPTLFVGLGNPGPDYASTYHNVGHMALQFFGNYLAKEYGAAVMQEGKNFTFQKYGVFFLIFPHTFMNESGTAVKEVLSFFSKKNENIVVFHDDSDLAVGEYREATGGAAGHHGVESIFRSLEAQPILRVRIGIRDPREKSGERPRRKAGDFVLKKISKKDIKTLEEKVFAPLAEQFLGEKS